jgi:HAD superfamily hydrolase (TIGR01509 family)
MRYDTLIFDLGFTIVTFENFTLKRYFKTLNKGLEALTQFLMKQKIVPRPDEFKKRFKTLRNRNFEKSLATSIEISTERTVAETLESLQLPALSPEMQTKASLIYHSTEGAFWQVRKTAKPVLEKLRAANYRLGVLSNAPFHKGIISFLEANNVSKYFHAITTSAQIGFTKPDRRTFEYTLAKLQSEPQRSVMIGDDLRNDIWGAQQLGMKAIHIRKGFKLPSNHTTAVEPDGVITDLPEILPIIKNWNNA